MTVDTKQVSGSHYKQCPPEFQHWNLVLIHGWDYFQAQAIKYIMRYKNKNGREDLKKALHFVEKMLETEESLAKIVLANPDPPVATFAEFLQYVKPTGWVGFTFEGAHAEGFLYTCSRCRMKILCEQFEPPWNHHDALSCGEDRN